MCCFTQLLEVMRMHKAYSCFVVKPTIEPSPNLGEVGMIIHVLHKHILFILNSSKLEGSERDIGRMEPHTTC